MKRKCITFGGIRISDMIFNNKILILISIIPFFKTSYYDVIPFLTMISTLFLCIEFASFLSICIVQKYLTRFSKIIILQNIWTFFLAPLISGYQAPSYYYMIQTIAALCFFEIGFRTNPIELVNILSKTFVVFTILNFATQIIPALQVLSDDGATVLLFGLRTGISLFVIPGILFNIIRDKYAGKTSIQTIVMFIISFISLMYDKVATGLFEFLIIVVLLLVLRRRRVTKINFGYIAIGILIFDLLYTVGAKNFNFISLIASWFNKDVTLSGRTLIWAKVILKLNNSPIAGYGLDSNVPIGLTFRSAHNQWLHFAMEGGYVALGISVFAVIMVVLHLKKKQGKAWYPIYCTCMIAMIIGSITEIQTYVPFFYIILGLPFLLDLYFDRRSL